METTDLSSNSADTPEQPVVFILRHSPYSSSLLSEGLDAVLAALSFDQPVELLIADDATFGLIENQTAEATGQKNIGKVLSVLSVYGLERIWVCRDSAEQRNLSNQLSQHPLPLMLVGYDAQQVILNEAKHVLSF